MELKCPVCNSDRAIKNGRINKKIQKYKCNKCNKYFTTSTFRKIPKTEIPFYFIINELRNLKDLKQLLGEEFKSGYYRNHFNQMYYLLDFQKEFPLKRLSKETENEKSDITRQRIYYWKKKFSKYLDDEEVIEEAKKYVNLRRRKIIKKFIPEEIPNDLCFIREKQKHLDILKDIEDIIGQENLKKIIGSDKIFGVFSELFNANRYKLVRKIKWEKNIRKLN